MDGPVACIFIAFATSPTIFADASVTCLPKIPAHCRSLALQARDGLFLHNLKGHSAIVNTLALNDDKVLFSGADNGSMTMWDYKTGYPFQTTQSLVQPGSLDAEAGIYASSFDMTGSRLITGEADKTIKIWQEDDNATPETHPVDMRQWTKDYHARRR
jgi:pleiotropic regulator 1